MRPRRLVRLSLAPLVVLFGLGAERADAGGTLSTAAKFTRGPHPKSQILWLRASAVVGGPVVSIRYARNYDPADKGKISGSCGVPGREGSIAIRQLKVRERRAARGYLFPRPLAEGDRVTCRVRFKKMPAVPDGSWSELRIQLSAPEVLPP